MFTKLLIISIIFGIANASLSSNLIEIFKKHEIVPDVIEIAPPESVQILYPGELAVEEGNELTPTQVKDTPTLKWSSKDDEFYTLIMTDPDAPSRQEPVAREWHHWLVVNIPGGHIDQGQSLTDYVGSGPPEGTGLHRYVFLVYKQNGKITPTENVINNTTGANREKFSAKKFAEKYKLNLLAGNFYQAQYDDYVPRLHAQLGVN